MRQVNTLHFQSILDDTVIHFDDDLEAQIAQLLRKLNLTVAIGEGVTGGLVSERLTRLPGSSFYFLGSVVSYSSLSKIQLLRVKPHTIQESGIISSQVALEMAKGVKELFKSDIAIGITGVAGPANDHFPITSLGKIFVAFITKTKEKVLMFQCDGTRKSIREKAAQAALVQLRNYILVSK